MRNTGVVVALGAALLLAAGPSIRNSGDSPPERPSSSSERKEPDQVPSVPADAMDDQLVAGTPDASAALIPNN